MQHCLRAVQTLRHPAARGLGREKAYQTIVMLIGEWEYGLRDRKVYSLEFGLLAYNVFNK